MNHLIDRNIESILTWVLKKNPSSKFYEKLQAQPLEEDILDIGGISYVKCAYGWQDLKKAINEIQELTKY